MRTLHFPPDFLWGAATSSYQVEGAVSEDGRSASIWDTFSRQEGAILNGDTGDIAADQYHRYQEDVDLLHTLGFQAYRFSIAWPRILPQGRGDINQKGLDYYKRLCTALHEKGIKTTATLYHWDLPQVLQDAGGWTTRETSYAFAEYAAVCFDGLKDYVDYWTTFNEPYCSAYLGYYTGEHAPGHHSLEETVKAIHHLNLAHGLAMEEYRSRRLPAPIGITWNPTTPRPATRRSEDKEAALLCKMVETDVFTHPVLGKGYPRELRKYGFDFDSIMQLGDLEIIGKHKLDFIGINFYHEKAVTWSENSPFHFEFVPSWEEKTDMGWPLAPEGLLRMLHIFAEEAPGIPLYITENGCAADDIVEKDGTINDVFRIKYFGRHFEVCQKAIEEGIPLAGYYVWSMLDNYEWAWGYAKRFGIIHVDYKTQERTPKNSAYYIRDVIAGYGVSP